jgi:hypothetical protein
MIVDSTHAECQVDNNLMRIEIVVVLALPLLRWKMRVGCAPVGGHPTSSIHNLPRDGPVVPSPEPHANSTLTRFAHDVPSTSIVVETCTITIWREGSAAAYVVVDVGITIRRHGGTGLIA